MRKLLLLTILPILLSAPENSLFLQKYNAFADTMNKMCKELQVGMADLKKFRKAKKLFDDLYKDEGWLK
jgi:hypothetical protein